MKKIESPARVVLIDDHPLLRKGLQQLIDDEDSLEVVGEAGDGAKGLELANDLNPDLILLDLNMKGMDGIQTLKAMRAAGIGARIIILTVSEHRDDVAAMFRAGADGYLLKDMDPEELLKSIEQAASGRLVVDERLAEVLASVLRPVKTDSSDKLKALTPKEREVLGLIAEGLSNKLIARRMDISEGTIKVHVKRILKKMEVRSRVEAAVWMVNQSKNNL